MSAVSFDGVFHDGRFASEVPVRIMIDADSLVLSDGVVRGHLAREGIVVDAPVPGVPRTLRFADGSTIDTDDHAAVAALWPTRGRIARLAYALEARWPSAIGSIAATAALIWLVVAIVLPGAAEPVAARISPRVDEFLGKQTLATLDRTFLKPSELDPAEREKWDKKFAEFLAGEPRADHYALEFRHLGTPNAFALPDGTIVVTDEMVRAVESDDELLAVFAHEIGHVHERHAIRLLLHRSGLAVLLAAVAGDAVGVTYLAVALPSMLLQSSYSREFETEADDYAFALLKRKGVSPQAFADLMRRLQQEDAARHDDGAAARYLSSHPATEERIRRAEQAR